MRYLGLLLHAGLGSRFRVGHLAGFPLCRENLGNELPYSSQEKFGNWRKMPQIKEEWGDLIGQTEKLPAIFCLRRVTFDCGLSFR